MNQKYDVTWNPSRDLTSPIHWESDHFVLVKPNTDLFDSILTEDFIESVFAVMARSPNQTFLVSTKYPERMFKWFGHSMRAGFVYAASSQDLGKDNKRFKKDGSDWLGWPLPNVSLGLIVENQSVVANLCIPDILMVPNRLRLADVDTRGSKVTFTDILFKGGSK